MLTLGLDACALTATVSLVEDGKVLALLQSTNRLNHSVRLLPMIEEVLKISERELTDLDLIAISAGPGSFTGVRIGISTVKGLAFGDTIPCVPVSTLEALAYTQRDTDALVCPLMDARRGEFYQALFQASHGDLKRLYDDRPIDDQTLYRELSQTGKRVLLCGDGAELFSCAHADDPAFWLASPVTRLQNAASVALIGEARYQDGFFVKASALAPIYLRQSGAERKRQKTDKEV